MDRPESAPEEVLVLDLDTRPEIQAETRPGTDPVDDLPVSEYPDPPRTGDVAVDAALDAVAGAVGGPLEEQLAVYESAHRTLQDRLADVEG